MTTKIRTLIVDDEPMARERVLALLAAAARHRGGGRVRRRRAGRHRPSSSLEPELVFLDVQMPGHGRLRRDPRASAPNRMPMVVFTTAYDEYALQAFEVHALDYLLKPFDRDRASSSTLERARERLERQRAGDLGKRLLAMVQDLRPEPAQPPDRLVVKSGGRIFFVRTDEIDWIDAAGNYVRLHVKGESYLFRETMTAMEARLDHAALRSASTARTSSTPSASRNCSPDNGDYTVVLRSGARLPLSRGYRDKLQERIAARN